MPRFDLKSVQSLARIIRYEKFATEPLTKYGKRARVENAIGNYKSINDSTLRLRNVANQKTEVILGCSVYNRML